MLQRFLFCTCMFLSVLMLITVVVKPPTPRGHSFPAHTFSINTIDKMPLVQDIHFAHLAHGYAPVEQRDASVRPWLAPGLKINVKGASGSGTIIYYNEQDGYAYMQSCGHLWDGSMTAQEGRSRNVTCTVTTWYHNQMKLNAPKTYPAEVLYFNNARGRDVSLLRFKPDWIPEYFPIAPEDFVFSEGLRLHSVGCDHGSEVAHYDVQVAGMQNEAHPSLVTTQNSPRPGRSGGGLSSDEFYVGICWGTSAFDGSGNGFFTPLKTIRAYNEANGFGWLNDMSNNLARQIPIIDRNGPQRKHPKDYIPIPSHKSS